MTNDKSILIFTETEKPKNCKIRINDMKAFYQISINKKQFNSLNEDDKIHVYKYLNELEEKIKKLDKVALMIFENNND
jgi:hypothetical protein